MLIAKAGVLQVAWGSSQDAQTLWQAVQGLLVYPHIWVRKATARLLGLVLASPSIGELLVPPGQPFVRKLSFVAFASDASIPHHAWSRYCRVYLQ